MHLYRRSIDVILQNQHESGAYVAAPDFPSYAYCWLRDGSFIAHAMDRVGKHESARAFFRWVDRAIQRHAWKVDRALEAAARGEPLDEDDYLHTRFTLTGEEAGDDWWNFQLDGYGTWLWALDEHIARVGNEALLDEIADSVRLTVQYLAALWRLPTYDCWEEHPQYTHPYTLAAIYAGLQAAERMGVAQETLTRKTAAQIRRFVLERGVRQGHLVKHISLDRDVAVVQSRPPVLEVEEATAVVDASLIGVATPYRLFAPDDPIVQATIARIEDELRSPDGGVYRYLADTYYGGGEWILLTAWLGWYYAEVGRRDDANELVNWVEAQADADGHLPEQVPTHLLAPERYEEWHDRWGPIATPLLWSHAMYLILCDALGEVE